MNEELAQKLKPQVQRDPNEFTTHEYAQAVGLGRAAAKDRLSKLVKQGRIVRQKVTYMNAAGIVMTSWGYRYVGDKDGER